MSTQSCRQLNGLVFVGSEEQLEGGSSLAQQKERNHSTPGIYRGSARVVGDYVLGKTLGVGSVGKVKLAHHVNSGEKVCLSSEHPSGANPDRLF